MSWNIDWTPGDFQEVCRILRDTMPEDYFRFSQPVGYPHILVWECPTISSIELSKLDDIGVQMNIYAAGRDLEIYLMKFTDIIQTK